MSDKQKKLKQLLQEVFALAAKNYNPDWDIANEDKNDPNFPASCNLQESVI